LDAQISGENKNIIKSILKVPSNSIDLKLLFTTFEYDPQSGQYFKHIYQTQPLIGCIEKDKEEYNIEVSDIPSDQIPSPENFAFKIAMIPKGKSLDQKILLVNEKGNILTSNWG